MSHPYLYFQKHPAWHYAFSVKICWITLAFPIPRRKDCLIPPWLPVHSTVLLFLFLSLSGFSHWISEYPGPLHHGQPGWGPGSWPGAIDLQHGSCGHWKRRCFAPTHPAAFSTLPCECLPSLLKTPMCPSLTVYDPGFLVGYHKTILILLLPVSILPTHMGCFPLPLLLRLPAPQLSKCCVSLLVLLWPSAQWEHWIELGGEERPSQICTPAFSFWTDHCLCLLSPWSSAQCLCPQERKGNMSWHWSRSYEGPWGSSPTSSGQLSPREVSWNTSIMFWAPSVSSALYSAPLGAREARRGTGNSLSNWGDHNNYPFIWNVLRYPWFVLSLTIVLGQ